MTVDIFIVSYERDFRYLKYALRSIHRFASGFHNIVLLVPNNSFDVAVDMVRRDAPDVTVRSGDEWVGKGFLWHMYEIMRADQNCPEADFILHMDSDCIFTALVTPEHYFVDGKPILMHASYDWLVTQQANLLNWKVAAQNALGFEVTDEFMRRHPAVHYRKTYEKTRECIQACHNISVADWMKQQKNSFPQSAAEFPTLGAVAWKFFHDDYHWINQQTEGFPHDSRLHQAWSHREPTPEDIAEFAKLGLT